MTSCSNGGLKSSLDLRHPHIQLQLLLHRGCGVLLEVILYVCTWTVDMDTVDTVDTLATAHLWGMRARCASPRPGPGSRGRGPRGTGGWPAQGTGRGSLESTLVQHLEEAEGEDAADCVPAHEGPGPRHVPGQHLQRGQGASVGNTWPGQH